MAESRNCKVKGCSGRALHELPEDEEKRRIWTAALNLEVQYAPKSKVMCTEHFQMLDCIDVSSSKGSLSTTSGGSLDEDEDPLKLKKKEKSLLPKQATSFLRSWLSQHVTYPYPTDVQKRQIAAQTNLSLKQVTNWFINARRRLLHPMVDAPNGISASAEPSAENVDAGKSPHQKNVGVRTNSRPRQKVPAKVLSPFQVKKKVDVDPLAIPESIIDLTGYIQPTTLICSSTLLGTPNVSVANGQNMGSPEFRLKGAAKRANSSSTILKSTTKTGLKVLLPTATSRTAKPRRPRKSSSTLSDFQRQPADDDSNYTQAAKIAKTYRPIRPKPMTSSANQDVNPSPTVTSSSERQSDGVSTSSAPWGSVSGEDLLDTLYEVLYLKPPKITEDKDGKPVPQETATLQKLSNGQGTSADGDAATGGTKAATTSLTTQTWWETKHRGTQTNNSIHTAVLSYEMYKFKAEWVVYHTGLVNFEQFTLVLNSLSPDAYNLKYKSVIADSHIKIR